MNAFTLEINRYLDASPAALFRCWTEPTLMRQCYCPLPWRVTTVESEVKTGGNSLIVMEGPNGERFENYGVYLELVPNRKLVFTDAFTRAWQPSAKPFMVGEVSFEPEGQGTRYIARAHHWTAADRDAHETMGFTEGWGIVATQMEALAKTL